jgi:hypothetical protein
MPRPLPPVEIAEKHKQLGAAQTQADRATRELRYMVNNINRAYPEPGSNDAVKIEQAIAMIADVRQSIGNIRHDWRKEFDLPF